MVCLMPNPMLIKMGPWKLIQMVKKAFAQGYLAGFKQGYDVSLGRKPADSAILKQGRDAYEKQTEV